MNAKNAISDYESATRYAKDAVLKVEAQLENERRKSNDMRQSGSDAVNAKDARIATLEASKKELNDENAQLKRQMAEMEKKAKKADKRPLSEAGKGSHGAQLDAVNKQLKKTIVALP